MSNEITVKIKSTVKELYNILEMKGFKIVEKFTLNDTYYIPKDLNINNMTCRDILSKAILLREVTDLITKRNTIKLTFKNKQIDDKGNILSQSKAECDIFDIEEGNTFIEAIGYRKIMNIRESDIVYGKNGFQMAIKNIENGDFLMEVETVEGNKELDTTEKLKQKISELKIPIDTNDYFVKKAEIELNKILLDGGIDEQY